MWLHTLAVWSAARADCRKWQQFLVELANFLHGKEGGRSGVIMAWCSARAFTKRILEPAGLFISKARTNCACATDQVR